MRGSIATRKKNFFEVSSRCEYGQVWNNTGNIPRALQEIRAREERRRIDPIHRA